MHKYLTSQVFLTLLSQVYIPVSNMGHMRHMHTHKHKHPHFSMHTLVSSTLLSSFHVFISHPVSLALSCDAFPPCDKLNNASVKCGGLNCELCCCCRARCLKGPVCYLSSVGTVVVFFAPRKNKQTNRPASYKSTVKTLGPLGAGFQTPF